MAELHNVVEVAVGLIQNSTQAYLLAVRPAGTDYAGYWEFPGGKIECGETPFSALQRELQEELGIIVLDAECVLVLPFEYPGKSVRLHCFEIKTYEGTPVGAEGQQLAWCSIAAIKEMQLLAGSRVLLDKIMAIMRENQ